MIIRKIIKLGGTYAITLPKGLIELYKWEEGDVVIVEMNSEKLVIMKMFNRKKQ